MDEARRTQNTERITQYELTQGDFSAINRDFACVSAVGLYNYYRTKEGSITQFKSKKHALSVVEWGKS